MTKLLELNLATNDLKELPQSIGRMTRLVTLNLSDNKLTDLPLSLGYCVGLSKIGAGINMERNNITDTEMLRKYKIGSDHMHDYLEKRMIVLGEPKLEEYELPFGVPTAVKQATTPVVAATKKVEPPKQQEPSKAPLDEKIVVLKKWAHTTIQSELRPKLTQIQDRNDAAVDPQHVVALAQIIKNLKPEVDKAKLVIPPFETPKAKLQGATTKIEQLKAVVSASVDELALTFRGIQKVLETTDSSKDVITMVQLVKGLKGVFDSTQI